jgi:DNA-binding protein YbaB
MATPSWSPDPENRSAAGLEDPDTRLHEFQTGLDRIEEASLARRAVVVRGSSAGGSITAEVNGLGQVAALRISSAAVDALPGPALGAAIVEAVSDARRKAAQGLSDALDAADGGLMAVLAAAGPSGVTPRSQDGRPTDASDHAGEPAGAYDPARWGGWTR